MEFDKRPTSITGSRAVDLTIFLVMLGLMLAAAPRLRVYFQVTMVDVSVMRIAPDGSQLELATPTPFKHVGDGYWRGDVLMERLRPQIDSYMRTSQWMRDAAAGTRFEWTVR
ncbi:MAG TPA: hypothetical protein VL282_02235, partial [Tepidisphaeraceae bacterium]|nr:hypothetical protein [Tepidisphaeraceae bacterium]